MARRQSAEDRFDRVRAQAVHPAPTNDLEELVLQLDATLSDMDAARRKGYLSRDRQRLRQQADAIRARRKAEAVAS